MATRLWRQLTDEAKAQRIEEFAACSVRSFGGNLNIGRAAHTVSEVLRREGFINYSVGFGAFRRAVIKAQRGG
ncbi:hypothetical protein B0G69_0111 [Paraburkholderia sp. RAU2J]|uniref:hypothetical protein n=1 Tax=Paraburkholderia sp. RAU2J TaxID=1938810 RepID=UPI000EB0AA5B|nr:hypothetical protein [Paraburkholderia sp. RAU2J]RKT24444.1 hypothetical protein B0G69_0111 [Paraburkholderia sp. RAU2J]